MVPAADASLEVEEGGASSNHGPRRGIMAPTPRPSPEVEHGPCYPGRDPWEDSWKKSFCPSSVEDIRMRTLVERTRALLRESEDGTLAPSAEDIRNQLLLMQSQHRPCESRDSHVAAQRGAPSHPRAGPRSGI